MPTPEDYKAARALALKTLKTTNLEERCQKAGVPLEGEETRRISIPFLGMVYSLSVEDDTLFFDESVKLQDQVLLLHYLITATGTPVTDKWITFREVPSGPFYYSPFVKRAIAPLVSCFGNAPEGLERVAPQMGHMITTPGDKALKVQALPRVPVVLSLWKGDDEFPPDGNVYFDASVTSYLTTEDIAYLAGAVVYKTIGLARALDEKHAKGCNPL